MKFDLKACTQPHALLHSLTGIGLGLILVALAPSLVANALMLGVVAVVVGVVGEMMVKK